MPRSRRKLSIWFGIPLLLMTLCCAYSVQGPVWGQVEVADGAQLDDAVVYLYCRSHAFHGSYTADSAYRVAAVDTNFVFPWMFGGIAPTGCTASAVHPLYQPVFANFEKGFWEALPPLRLEPWDALLREAEAGGDVSPVTLAELNQHVSQIRTHFMRAHRGDPETVAHYIPELYRIYESGLDHLPKPNRSTDSRYALENLRALEEESGYQRPPTQSELFAAASRGDTAGVIAALDAGADPDFRNADGAAALHLAAEAGTDAIVSLLLDRGATIDLQRRGHGNSALLDAVLHHEVDTAILLLARGADPALPARGRTPLSAVAQNGGERRLFVALLDHGALEKASAPRDVVHALHNASRSGRVDLVELLLERGVPADASWETLGWTALMLAALDGQPDTAQLLIDAGADVNARADDGRTPLVMARQRDPAPRRRDEVVALLEASGARE